MESDANAVGGLEAVEIEIAALGGHFSCVHEDRHVDDAGRQPAVFRAQQQQVLVLEPEVRVSTKRVRASERGQQVIRNHLPVFHVGGLRQRAKCEHPVLFQQRDVLPEVGVETAEAEVVFAVSKLVQSNRVQTAAARIAWRFAPVDEP